LIRIAPLIAVSLGLVIYLGLALSLWKWSAQRPDTRRAWWTVGFAVLAGIAIQVAVQFLTNPDPLIELMLRTTSPYLGGYHDAAIHISSLDAFLRNFPDLARGYHVHPQRHPPGQILYFVLWWRALEHLPGLSTWLAGTFHFYRCEYWPLLFASDAQFASALGGLLALVCNAVAVVPLYLAARRFLGWHAALGAALISPLIPGYALWAGIWDQAFILVTALLLWLLTLALHDRRHRVWWAAGGLLSAASFFSYAMLILVGFGACYTLVCLWNDRDYWWPRKGLVALNGLRFLVGLASVWFGYWLFFGVSFVEAYRANTENHFAMSSHYLLRLFYNPYDFLFFLGYVVGLLGVAAVWKAARAAITRRPLSLADGLVMAFALVFVTLTVSGISRAEVGRVWLFLMPLAVVAAFAVPDGPAHSPARWLITAALLAAQTVVMQSTIVTTGRNLMHAYEMPGWAIPVGTRVGGAMELEGYELWTTEFKPGDTIHLTLHWKARETPPGFYVSFVHVYDGALGLAAQYDGPPRNNQYPTTCWRPGEVVSDNIDLPIAAEAAPGTYSVIVGMYDPATPNHQRLSTEGLGARDLSIFVTQIRIVSGSP
jgi:hypothetical protein